MVDTWRQRLEAALKEKDLSKREVSIAATLSPGYVHGILKEGKDPTLGNLLSVAAALDVSPMWLIFGIEASSDADDLLALWNAALPETRQGILSILRSHKAA